jgi:hypothetical protein
MDKKEVAKAAQTQRNLDKFTQFILFVQLLQQLNQWSEIGGESNTHTSKLTQKLDELGCLTFRL